MDLIEKLNFNAEELSYINVTEDKDAVRLAYDFEKVVLDKIPFEYDRQLIRIKKCADYANEENKIMLIDFSNTWYRGVNELDLNELTALDFRSVFNIYKGYYTSGYDVRAFPLGHCNFVKYPENRVKLNALKEFYAQESYALERGLNNTKTMSHVGITPTGSRVVLNKTQEQLIVTNNSSDGIPSSDIRGLEYRKNELYKSNIEYRIGYNEYKVIEEYPMAGIMRRRAKVGDVIIDLSDGTTHSVVYAEDGALKVDTFKNLGQYQYQVYEYLVIEDKSILSIK